MELKAETYVLPGNGRGGATSRVYEALREAIVSLEIAPGAVIEKGVLCQKFGLSRFPVSEALSRLQAEGLVDIQPQRGTRAALIRLSDAHENMFLRRTLESAAVRTLASKIDAGRISALSRNIRYQRSAVKAGDRIGFHTLDVEFHAIMLDGIGFPKVKAAVESARLALERVRRLLASPRRHAVTLKEHQRILRALEERDGEKAAKAMITHLDAVNRELRSVAKVSPQIFADLNEELQEHTWRR